MKRHFRGITRCCIPLHPLSRRESLQATLYQAAAVAAFMRRAGRKPQEKDCGDGGRSDMGRRARIHYCSLSFRSAFYHTNILVDRQTASQRSTRPAKHTCIIRDSDGGPFTLTKSSYNQLRLAPSFWRALPAEWILFFERDSVLCGRGGGGSRPPPPLTFFIEQGFDYIGAPWSHSSSGRIIGSIHATRGATSGAPWRAHRQTAATLASPSCVHHGWPRRSKQ